MPGARLRPPVPEENQVRVIDAQQLELLRSRVRLSGDVVRELNRPSRTRPDQRESFHLVITRGRQQRGDHEVPVCDARRRTGHSRSSTPGRLGR